MILVVIMVVGNGVVQQEQILYLILEYLTQFYKLKDLIKIVNLLNNGYQNYQMSLTKP